MLGDINVGLAPHLITGLQPEPSLAQSSLVMSSGVNGLDQGTLTRILEKTKHVLRVPGARYY